MRNKMGDFSESLFFCGISNEQFRMRLRRISCCMPALPARRFAPIKIGIVAEGDTCISYALCTMHYALKNMICAQRILRRINASAHPRINAFRQAEHNFVSQIHVSQTKIY